MVLLVKKIIGWYFYIFNDLADPRAADFPLMSSPLYVFAICFSYLYFVKKLGPRLMENREPLNIKKFIIAFNIIQIVSCAFLVYKFVTVCAFRFSWLCEPIDYGTNWYANIQLFYTWIYFMIKVLDLLDTVFFVLRKKTSHVSFLHLYHHTGMVLLTWVGCKFIAGGHGLYVGFANCIVHTCMYFYYLISIWDEKYKKSIWWKKYITQLQMGQFLFLCIIFGQVLFQPKCTYPKWMVVIFLPQNLFMFVLFSDFYYNAYIKVKQPKTVREMEPVSAENEKEQLVSTVNRIKDDVKTK